jgi:hypothetical protein
MVWKWKPSASTFCSQPGRGAIACRFNQPPDDEDEERPVEPNPPREEDDVPLLLPDDEEPMEREFAKLRLLPLLLQFLPARKPPAA